MIQLMFIAYYPMKMLIYNFLSSFCRTICCTTKVNEQEVLRAVCVYVCVFVSQVDVVVLISCYQFRIWIQFDDWPQILIMKISILNPCTKFEMKQNLSMFKFLWYLDCWSKHMDKKKDYEISSINIEKLVNHMKNSFRSSLQSWMSYWETHSAKSQVWFFTKQNLYSILEALKASSGSYFQIAHIHGIHYYLSDSLLFFWLILNE